MQIPIITLTSDLGLRDHYVPSVKGYLQGRLPAAKIIDITHQIEPFNLAEASFVLRNCYRDFPEGTIHIVSVDSDYEMEAGFVLVKTEKHYFLGHNNGLISLILEPEQVQAVYELPFQKKDLIFSLRNVLAPAACRLAEAGEAAGIYETARNYMQKANLRPVLEENIIRGTIIYIDNTGNAISNVTAADMERYGLGRKFRIYISRKEYFESLSETYSDVEEGEKLCLFNSYGQLEIAINKGNASRLLGLQKNHIIVIEFL